MVDAHLPIGNGMVITEMVAVTLRLFVEAAAGMTGCRFTASAQAMSSATGSYDANIPTSGTIGRSFSEWQSQ